MSYFSEQSSDLAKVGEIKYGALKTGVSFSNGVGSILATLTLPVGKWIVIVRCNVAGSTATMGTTIDVSINTGDGDACTLTIPDIYKWDRKNLVAIDYTGGKTLNVVATPYGTPARDQIACQNLYAMRIK